MGTTHVTVILEGTPSGSALPPNQPSTLRSKFSKSRSKRAPIRSNDAPTRSNDSPTRSNDAPTDTLEGGLEILEPTPRLFEAQFGLDAKVLQARLDLS